MPVTDVPGSTVRERAYHLIQTRIANGDFPPGVAVSELGVAKELGISRTPVREAIGQLTAEGILRQIPNRGAVVADLSRQDIIELYELREALEVFAIRKVAASGVRGPELAELNSILNSLDRLRSDLRASGSHQLDDAGMKQVMRADIAFHTLLLRSASNRRFIKVVSDSRVLLRIFNLLHQNHTLEQVDEIAQTHRAILDAVLRRDADAAAVRLCEHIRSSCQERLDAFDRRELANLGVA